MRNEKGSITLYVLLSMLFFLIIIVGIYVSSSNKVQVQEKEVKKIQQEYEKENIDDLYKETYDTYYSK